MDAMKKVFFASKVPMAKEKLAGTTFYGVPVEELDRDELMVALYICHQQLEAERQTRYKLDTIFRR